MKSRYVLDEQVGFLLRRANQRHTSVFSGAVNNDIPPSQFAVLAKLAEVGPVSQNELGRLTAMDSATIKGVVDRLTTRNFLMSVDSPHDTRLRVIDLTAKGRKFLTALIPVAKQITEDTLAPLSLEERRLIVRLLKKLG